MIGTRRSFVREGLVLCAVWIALAMIGSGPAQATGTSILKLMVLDCFTEDEIDNALVEVVIWRLGEGEIDSDSDYTDVGYVEFTFSDLEDGDKARVTVTPPRKNPDSSHVYYWVEVEDPPGADAWDLAGGLDDICEDGWWDKSSGILECLYRDPGKN